MDKLTDQLISQITMDDIPDNYRYIAEAIGIKNFLKLINLVGGTVMYLPLPMLIMKKVRNKAIIQEYKGYNIKELAIKYNVSENGIKFIINKSKENANS
ncbi:MAG: Mor transcription activator family protein [Bacteroidota bacterium]